MATYGYSTPYTGQRQPTLPPGYMEAATAPGRNIAAGIQQFAAGLGQTIQRYRDKKAETEAATQTFETLSGMASQALSSDPQYQALQQYYETGQLPSGVTQNDLRRFETKVQADRSMLNKMAGIGEKFGDMSLAKKKAAIGDMAMVLGQYQNRATEDLKRRQLELSVSEAERALKTEQDIADLTRYAAGLPSTRTVQEQVPVELQPIGPMPADQMAAPVLTPSGGQPSPTEAALAQRFLAQAGIAGEQLRRFADQQVSGITPPSPGQYFPTGVTASPARPIPIPQAPQQAALSQELYRRQVEAAKAAAGPMREQANIIAEAASRPLQYQAPAAVPAPSPTEIGLPPAVTVQEQAQRTEQIPYSETRQQLAQFAAQSGMRPQAFAAIDTVLQAAGRQKPLQVEQQMLPGGAQVIRADGKVEVLPPPKPVEGKPLTESQGKAIQFAGAMRANNETVNRIIEGGYSPGGITVSKWTPERIKTEDRKAYEAARDRWIENFLRGRSGAAITEAEYPAAERQYFPVAGDSPAVIKAKAKAREEQYRGELAKGGDHASLYMQQIIGNAAPEQQSGQSVQTRRSTSGTTYQIQKY
jgi:hypothetical protein